MLLQSSKHMVLNLLRSKKNPASKIFLSPSLHSSILKDQYRPGSCSWAVTLWLWVRKQEYCDHLKGIFLHWQRTHIPHKTCSISQHRLTWSLQYHASKISQILDYALSHPLCVHWIYMMLAGLKESFFWFPRRYPLKVWTCNTLNMLSI